MTEVTPKKIRLLLNDKVEFPPYLLKMNKTLLLMLCDIKGVPTDLDMINVAESYDLLMERIDDDYRDEMEKMKSSRGSGGSEPESPESQESPKFPEPQKQVIPLDEWDERLFDFVIEFSKYHTNHPLEIKDDTLPKWDEEFLNRVKNTEEGLCGWLFQFANYLENELLLEVCAIYFSNLINGRNKNEVRKQFKIKNDFTEEEEKEIEEKLAWIEKHK